MNKRTAYLSTKELLLRKSPVKIWGCSKSGEVVCRLDISAAGIKVYEAGKTCIADLNWENLVDRLKKPKPTRRH
jgi:hypothetical protein